MGNSVKETVKSVLREAGTQSLSPSAREVHKEIDATVLRKHLSKRETETRKDEGGGTLAQHL